jgi:serine protease Do
MSQPVKTPTNAYVLIAAGFGLGAACMAGMFHSATAAPAYAQASGAQMRLASAPTSASLATLRDLDTSYANLADFVAPAVVDIESVRNSTRKGTDGKLVPLSGGEGSGFIFRSDGYIITNDHVVGGYDKVTVTLKDGREFEGKVTRAEDSDIALVKIDAKELPTLQLADSSKVRPGQTVMAIGAPFGLQQSVTFGHVSALGRMSEIQNKLYPDLIQTDASINMGNSGGPLVNIDGQVVGVNTSILSPSGVSAGIGFAIPSNQVRFIADILVEKGKLTRSMMGLIPENLKDYQKSDMKLQGGALVTTVTDNGPAQAAGIKKGDIVTRIGTTPIKSQLDLRNAMLVYVPGTTVPVELVRDGKTMTVNVKLVEYKRPVEAESPMVRDGNGRFRLPKELDPFIKDFPDLKAPDLDDPSDDVPPLREGKARLGIMVGDLTDQTRADGHVPSSVKGALVGSVLPGSVADKAGVKGGDVILSFDGKPVHSAKDLTDMIEGVKRGSTHTLKYGRYTKSGERTEERTVTFK